MKIQSIHDAAFAVYGKVVEGLDTAALADALNACTPKPDDGTVYVPSCAELEALPVYAALQDGVYGGMPIQIGYCNGTNTVLNCLEYHRDSEINVPAEDMVFLVARQQDFVDGVLDTAKVEAFRADAGTAVELYATTLHYAPCDAEKGRGFRVAVVLPRGTNTDKPEKSFGAKEERLLWARNKWLVAHPDSGEAKAGAFVGLRGENINIAGLIESPVTCGRAQLAPT
ncbi:MAG: DUF4867 family protein [Clostridia bacterium]|nr:DUF4867 family protein [Clostridia bacterium]